ncbi:MAG TPA: ABC transporter ATP-binding protein [bacterium]|nr:ABC transporter ATP-binding protein [bacterium]
MAGQPASAVRRASTAAVRLEGLTLRYGGRTALDAVTFDVGHGELFALLGPNGSGKSTLLRILSTLLRPGSGRALIDGVDVSEAPAAARHRLGVVFQAPSVDGKLSVMENLRFQGYLYGLSGKALTARIDTLLERFALGERRRDMAGKLSGGLRRRVELAKALLHRPRVLLLDEPSTGLDLPSRQAFWQTLDELRGEDALTVVVASHLMDEAERCGRVALLDGGRLVAVDTPGALKQELGDTVMTLEASDPAALLELLTQRMGLQGVVQDGTVRLSGTADPALAPRLLAEFPEQISALRLGRPTLADVFLVRTGHAMATEPEPAETA